MKYFDLCVWILVCFYFLLPHLWLISVTFYWFIFNMQVMNETEWEFCRQEQFGRAYSHDDCVVFSVSTHCIESVVSINMQWSCNIFVIHVSMMSVCAFVLSSSFKITGCIWVKYKLQHLSYALSKCICYTGKPSHATCICTWKRW